MKASPSPKTLKQPSPKTSDAGGGNTGGTKKRKGPQTTPARTKVDRVMLVRVPGGARMVTGAQAAASRGE